MPCIISARNELAYAGNVMVSPTHLGSPFDVVLPFPSSPSYDESLATFRVWAKAAHSTRKPSAPVIMQLCHTGRQSTRGSGRPLTQPALAPSAVPLKMGNDLLGKVLFGTPKAMTIQDIKEVIAAFVQGARVAKETGFDGIELHCSHGYLLAQFLSPNVAYFPCRNIQVWLLTVSLRSIFVRMAMGDHLVQGSHCCSRSSMPYGTNFPWKQDSVWVSS